MTAVIGAGRPIKLPDGGPATSTYWKCKPGPGTWMPTRNRGVRHPAEAEPDAVAAVQHVLQRGAGRVERAGQVDVDWLRCVGVLRYRCRADRGPNDRTLQTTSGCDTV